MATMDFTTKPPMLLYLDIFNVINNRFKKTTEEGWEEER